MPVYQPPRDGSFEASADHAGQRHFVLSGLSYAAWLKANNISEDDTGSHGFPYYDLDANYLLTTDNSGRVNVEFLQIPLSTSVDTFRAQFAASLGESVKPEDVKIPHPFTARFLDHLGDEVDQYSSVRPLDVSSLIKVPPSAKWMLLEGRDGVVTFIVGKREEIHQLFLSINPDAAQTFERRSKKDGGKYKEPENLLYAVNAQPNAQPYTLSELGDAAVMNAETI